MGDTSLNNLSTLSSIKSELSSLKNEIQTLIKDANDFASFMKSPQEQEEVVAESGLLNVNPLVLSNNRSDATASGASSIDAIKNKSSWFGLHNVHGNGSVENWLDRVQKGMFENGAGSITQAYQQGYFSDAPVQNAAKSLISEGAITQAQWDEALSRSAAGNPSAEDKYVLGTVGLRHAASFGGDENALNWNEDVLKEGTYLSYLDGKGISREFAHGTLNNFKSGISAVQTGGDALTVESGEWKLNNYKDWSTTWGEYINHNAAPASYNPVQTPTPSGNGNIPFHPGSGSGLPPPIIIPNFPNGGTGSGNNGGIDLNGGGINLGNTSGLPGIKEPVGGANTPNPVTGGNYQGEGEVQNLQAFRKRDGSNGYASYFNPGNVLNRADGGVDLQIKGTSSAEIISPSQIKTGMSITSTVVFTGTPRVVESIFAYGNAQGQLKNSSETTEFDIVETGLHPTDPNKFYSGWWADKYNKAEHFGWDRRDFGIEFGKPTTFVTTFKEDSFTIYVKQASGELKEVKTFYPSTMDRMNNTYTQMMYSNWLQDNADKNLNKSYTVLGQSNSIIDKITEQLTIK